MMLSLFSDGVGKTRLGPLWAPFFAGSCSEVLGRQALQLQFGQ